MLNLFRPTNAKNFDPHPPKMANIHILHTNCAHFDPNWAGFAVLFSRQILYGSPWIFSFIVFRYETIALFGTPIFFIYYFGPRCVTPKTHFDLTENSTIESTAIPLFPHNVA